MQYFLVIQAVISYVENRVKTLVNSTELEKITGFSLPHTRAVFAQATGVSLAKYVLSRKIANAAFEIAHIQRNILDIALDYGFDNYDTFTRAFRRVTGTAPRNFRKESRQVGRIKLYAGTYGPGISGTGSIAKEESNMKTVKSDNSCILHGVPKVEYKSGECTPFPACLKACLNYLGQDISYAYLMAVSGAAFRLRWNTARWDGGNVDLLRIYDNPLEAFERSFVAAGRSFRLLNRTSQTSKADFIGLIRTEIDQGRPVIALGIIGPPEACIITGYRKDGEILLGWNFFQDNPEFATDVSIDQTGYFACANWWENPNTLAVMSVSEEKGSKTGTKEVLENAIAVMTREQIGDYAGGQRAYAEWAKALSDDSQFPENAVWPLLFERLMCQGDAMDMIAEGRYYGAKYMELAAEEDKRISAECLRAAKFFKEEAAVAEKMSEVLGSWQRGEVQAWALARPAVRAELVMLIAKAKELDAQACRVLNQIVAKL
jgi:AraC-like DNA-binding protein